MQLVTVTFATGFAAAPRRAIVLRTIESSPVTMMQSEITTLLEETTSMPDHVGRHMHHLLPGVNRLSSCKKERL